jgi:methionine sulfoxide reductase heme-binding subunit
MSPTVWYLARASGITAYLVLSGSVIAGTLMSARVRFTWPRFAVEELHRFMTMLTGVFIIVHGGSLLLDRVVPISLGQELVPFASPYRPLAVGLGTTAAELMAAVGLTNLIRGRLPRRIWRRAHYLTIAVWAFASVHGVLAGSDRGDPWFAGIVASAACAVLLAFGLRTRAGLAPAQPA